MRLEQLINSIEDALKKECYLPALALVLTLPDIGAKYEYSKIWQKKETYQDRTGIGAAYSKWYDEYIRKYEIPVNCNDRQREITETGTIDGRRCWELRCGFLHAGEINIDKEMSDRQEDIDVKFRFIVSETTNKNIFGGCSTIICDGMDNKRQICIDLDIVNFCRKILEVFKGQYLSDKNVTHEIDIGELNFFEIV